MTGAAPLPGRRPQAGSANGETLSGRIRFTSRFRNTLRAVVQSVELLLEPAAERGVVRIWDALSEAGLPSQARHTAPSNRPHTTLVALSGLAAETESAVAAAVRGRLPVEAVWGAVTLFGRGPWVLVRLLEPSNGMRGLQAAVADACGVPDDSLSSPRQWTPHVTLARRVARADVDRAIGLVAALAQGEASAGVRVVASAVRRWDGSRRVEWEIGRAQVTPRSSPHDDLGFAAIRRGDPTLRSDTSRGPRNSDQT